MATRAVSPPAMARPNPKTSSSSITPSHGTSSSQSLAGMPSSSSRARSNTPGSSRAPAKAGDGHRPNRETSKDSLKQKMIKKSDDTTQPSKLEEQYKSLRSDFDGLRSHLTCKICDRLLYQPYTIACGHTYCYSCLCTWFVNNKARITCPDCRASVTQCPAPAYVIRDMALILMSKAELLPAGETIEQHNKWQKEETDAVQQDKDNMDPRTGGLFKGCFKTPHTRNPPLQVVRDVEDGVERCPICTWELEDGECVQCGLFFNDQGELTWGDSFTGFSDVDEMSEQDLSGEDFDPDMDMDIEAAQFQYPNGWQNYLPEDVVMQRFLGNAAMGPPGPGGRRRGISHSEAASRRGYSQSIASDRYTDEMDTVEEEDEDEEGEEGDSSMNDFIDDSVAASSSASSANGQTPQPVNTTAAPLTASQRERARRVVESETSSTVSGAIPEEEEDDEDQGPVRRGQRNRAQTRILNRANGVNAPAGPASSTSTDASMDELDEDTQALLQEQGWMMHPDDVADGNDSDGARTTVGWGATAISNERYRLGGSLTPTADRPRPNASIRSPSRVGNPLRRRTSTISASTANYEDGLADDDDSDVDQDGDVNMAINALRSRRSRVQLRNPAIFANYSARVGNRGVAFPVPVQDDVGEGSDTSQPRGQQRPQRQEYNPRISRLFADHQRDLQALQTQDTLPEMVFRSQTPVNRPRTSNRNRPSPAQMYSPFSPPAPTRMRTPLNMSDPNSRIPPSPNRRTVLLQNVAANTVAAGGTIAEYAPTVGSTSDASVIYTPGTSTPTSQRPAGNNLDASMLNPADLTDRPASHISRPPSTTGRRSSAGYPPVYSGFPAANVGLNMQGHMFPTQTLGNPWGAYVQPQGVRARGSRQVLRDPLATNTLRATASRTNLHDTLVSPSGIRVQPSRTGLRSQSSRRQLNPQASTRMLRASDQARPSAMSAPVTNAPNQTAARSNRLSDEEILARGRELTQSRALALQQAGAAPTRNPFVNGYRRPSDPTQAPVMINNVNGHNQHARSNSNDSNVSASSSLTATNTPASPVLARRRSNRHIAMNSPVLTPSAHAAYQTSPAIYNANVLRSSRQHPTFGGSTAISPLENNHRGLSSMVATPLI